MKKRIISFILIIFFSTNFLFASDPTVLTNWLYHYYNIDTLNTNITHGQHYYMDIAELPKNSYNEEVKIVFEPVLGDSLSFVYLDYSINTYDFTNSIPFTLAINNHYSEWNNQVMDNENTIYFTSQDFARPWKLKFRIGNVNLNNIPRGRYFTIFRMNIYLKNNATGKYETIPYYSHLFEFGGVIGKNPQSANKTILINTQPINTENLNLPDLYSSTTNRLHVGNVQVYITREGESNDGKLIDIIISPMHGINTSGYGSFKFVNIFNNEASLPYEISTDGISYHDSSFYVYDVGERIDYVEKNSIKGNPLHDEFPVYIRPSSSILNDDNLISGGYYYSIIYVTAILRD